MSFKKDLHYAACGLLMGSADIVPGVSGGTVALILGIYTRLVGAISRFDTRLIALVARGKLHDAALRVDLRFLFALGLGVVTGIASFATLMHHFLEHYLSYTMAAFFGLILASSWLVARMVRRETAWSYLGAVVIGIVGASVALAIVTQHSLGPRPGNVYTFGCGAIAICAMILPGISGAYILVLLGKYSEITGIIKDVVHLDVTYQGLITLGVFALGCGVGLVLFSKFLRWLLARWKAETISLLCGFMIGSLYRIWPFQRDLTSEVDKIQFKRFQPFWPSELNSEVIICLVIAISAMVVVLVLDRFAQRKNQHEPQAVS
jgi:putative membrane protein